MQLAKVTAKGQITIPINVRRRLGLDEGSYILFIERENGFFVMNESSVDLDMVSIVKPKSFTKSEDYVGAIMAFGETPDDSFAEPEDLPWATREELF